MIQACQAFPRPKLWGIGMYGSEQTEYRISTADHERDIAWATEQLRKAGVGHGTMVLSIAALWERPWIDAFWNGIRRLGGCIAYADIWSFDAHRTSLFLRRLDIQLVLGLSSDVAEVLHSEAQLGSLLAPIPHVLARPEALPLLTKSGLRPAAFLKLGPAVGVECPQRAGAHVDSAEWALSTDTDGQVLVSTIGPREHVALNAPTGVMGSVSTSPCACGSADARVVI